MKNRNVFQQFWCVRTNYNPNSISTCCDKSDALSHDELRAVPSAQIAILHGKLSWRQLKEKLRDGSRYVSESVAHLEDDCTF